MRVSQLTPKFLNKCVDETGITLVRGEGWVHQRRPDCGCLTLAIASHVSGKSADEIDSELDHGPSGAECLAKLAGLPPAVIWALSDGFEGDPNPTGPASLLPTDQYNKLYMLAAVFARDRGLPLPGSPRDDDPIY